MKHNNHNQNFEFCHGPVEFNKWTDKKLLQYCLGGTLYMPSTRKIADKLIKQVMPELTSMVMCFEDAICYEDVKSGEENVLDLLTLLAKRIADKTVSFDQLPLIFLRVKSVEQFVSFSGRLKKEQAEIITGFVFPKFYSNNAHAYIEHLKSLNDRFEITLYGMPILEGKAIAYRESRIGELEKLKLILDPYREYVLNIRIGGTDFSSLFGVRRSMLSSVYDILPVRDAISDILNFFNRTEDGYIVSAPVWEYFLAYKQDNIQKYIGSNIHRSLLNQESIVNEAVDGLLRESLQDKTNGMVGKTVIHPSHLRFVNAMQAVALEEYNDAVQILGAQGGVIKSSEGNKMNEVAPHRNWAEGVVLRAQAYGVIKDENECIKLFLD